jgi:hypothetical protein
VSTRSEIQRSIRLLMGLAAVRTDALLAGSNSTVTQRRGNLTDGPVLIYAHHSLDGIPLIHERACLDVAAASGLQVVSVVSSQRGTRASSQWDEFSSVVISRASAGRDLGAHRDAFSSLFSPGAWLTDPVHMTNDSVFWFSDAFPRMAKLANETSFDLTAATESLQPFRHLQSFWFSWKPAIRTNAVYEVLGAVANFALRQTVVSLGELGMLDRAAGQGLSCGAIWPFDRLQRDLADRLAMSSGGLKFGGQPPSALAQSAGFVPADRVAILGDTLRDGRYLDVARIIANGDMVNPTHFLWDLLLENGFPGVKRDLLQKNPSRIADWLLIPQHPRVRDHVGLFPLEARPAPPLSVRLRRRFRF